MGELGGARQVEEMPVGAELAEHRECGSEGPSSNWTGQSTASANRVTVLTA
jgi:hypothetical protein